ncbi:MAG TPA: PQQ-binding-like beta-propeller repeat protein [Verrucomicrobiae bacterium]|nr:PQQ-binding-like beta-propeller repeat protein [Verrucomicrobiae bacterium]
MKLPLLIALAVAALRLEAQDWPQFLGPNRNGSTSVTNLAAQWPREGPPVVWQRKAGQGFAGPVVSGGKLILFHRIESKEVVECLDANSGNEHWKADYSTSYVDQMGHDPGPRATPAIAEGRVYTFGAEGVMSCWSLADGKKLWSIVTKSEFGARLGFFGLACSPLVEGDAVIVNVGGRNGAGIVAFDKGNGKVLWKTSDDEASYASPVAATIGGRRVMFVLTREALECLSPVDGKSIFRYPWRPAMHASVSGATPLVVGDQLFISACYDKGATLLRFKEASPQEIWSSAEALSSHYATAVHRDGFLYGFDGRADPGFEPGPSLRCVELATGKVRWSQSGLQPGTVTLAGDALLVLTGKGELLRAPATPHGFKPSARAQILGLEVRAHPALADEMFYARSKEKLVCVDLRREP